MSINADFCNHYTGLSGPGGKQKTVCKAGVNYRELAGDSPGLLFRLPCTKSRGPSAVSCDKREMPTPEQIAAEEIAMKEYIRVFGLAVTACRENTKATGRRQGVVECPKCKGRLHYSIAASNGHVHGQCETAGCLSWMM